MAHCFFNFFATSEVTASLLRDVLRRVAHLGPVEGGEMSEGSFWYSSSSHFSKKGLVLLGCCIAVRCALETRGSEIRWWIGIIFR